MTEQQIDCDGVWKEALETYFEPFMSFFFPAAHLGIDWERGYEFPDKEFQQAVSGATIGRRVVDKLARAWRKVVMAHLKSQETP